MSLLGFDAIGHLALGQIPPVAVTFGWYASLVDPVKLPIDPKRAIAIAASGQDQFNPLPLVSFSWFAELSKPQRLDRPRLPAGEQQFISWTPSQISMSWFKELEEPPRFPKRLAAPFNPFHGFSNFVPLAYTAMINARETLDLFLGVVWEYGTPVSAIVEVNEIVQVASPVGLIENNHVSANVTLYEPVATPSSGTPILGVARANVAIREV